MTSRPRWRNRKVTDDSQFLSEPASRRKNGQVINDFDAAVIAKDAGGDAWNRGGRRSI
jgi:hypothetical protein